MRYTCLPCFLGIGHYWPPALICWSVGFWCGRHGNRGYPDSHQTRWQEGRNAEQKLHQNKKYPYQDLNLANRMKCSVSASVDALWTTRERGLQSQKELIWAWKRADWESYRRCLRPQFLPLPPRWTLSTTAACRHIPIPCCPSVPITRHRFTPSEIKHQFPFLHARTGLK